MATEGTSPEALGQQQNLSCVLWSEPHVPPEGGVNVDVFRDTASFCITLAHLSPLAFSFSFLFFTLPFLFLGWL